MAGISKINVKDAHTMHIIIGENDINNNNNNNNNNSSNNNIESKNNNSNNSNDGRQSESPARTIDSHNSTNGSLETIIDRNDQQNQQYRYQQQRQQQQQQSQHFVQHDNQENFVQTNIGQQKQQQQKYNNSLRNSANAIIQQHQQQQQQQQQLQEQQQNQQNATSCINMRNGNEGEQLHQQSRQIQQYQTQQQQQQQLRLKPLDSQSHIYSSPVYEEKPQLPIKLNATTTTAVTATTLTTMPTTIKLIKQINERESDGINSQGDLKKPKLVTHEEFRRQLEEAMAHKAATIDSRISKKQRFPPELIKDDGSSMKSSKLYTNAFTKTKLYNGISSGGLGVGVGCANDGQTIKNDDCCLTFPVQIILGLLQLVLAVSLVALGSLLIVREAALSTAGCGIWTGLIAAITGSIGVVGLTKTQTAFLALSLVCIATSTLALAITGIGLSRDVNQLKENFDLLNANNIASAASGLIFALFLHFVISVISVYRCALQICSRSQSHSELQDIFIKSNISNMQLHQSSKETSDKLTALWMMGGGSLGRPISKLASNHRPIMLIPANTNNVQHVVGTHPRVMINATQPSPLLTSPYAALASCPGLSMPYVRTNSMPLIYAPPLQSSSIPNSMPGTFRMGKYYRTVNGVRRKRRPGQLIRTNKVEAQRKEAKRRKSDADTTDGKLSFRYTGLDRVIADNFLARQEQTHNTVMSNNSCNKNEYTSSSSSNDSETYGDFNAGGAGSVATPTKTQVLCQDVVM